MQFKQRWNALRKTFDTDVFEYLQPVNVVVVGSIVQPCSNTTRSRMLGGAIPTKIPWDSTTTAISCDDPGKRYSQYMMSTTRNGKFTIFSSGNLIRPGRQTHGDGIHSFVKVHCSIYCCSH